MYVGNLDKSKMQLLEISEYGKDIVHKTNFTQIYLYIHAETIRKFILHTLFVRAPPPLHPPQTENAPGDLTNYVQAFYNENCKILLR